MNKAKQMQKKLVKQAAVVGGIVLCSAVAMLFTSGLADSASQRKTAAEGARSGDSSKISTIRSQIEQSGDAERRFIDISLKHTSSDYSANTDTLKNWLRDMKNQYRFSDSFKLTLALDKPSDKPEFGNLNFVVTVRAPMKLEFGAISDMHVFSFLQQLERDMPGMVRITKFSVGRKNDMTASSFRDMANGSAAEFVASTIEFTWIGIEPKKVDPVANPSNAAPAAPGGI